MPFNRSTFKNKRHYLLMLIMISASVFAFVARPTHKIADEGEQVNLEQLIPAQFNDWRMLNMASQIVNPETAAALDKIYAQTLSRVYENSQGQRIMVSIAYGRDQTDSVGAHLPEGCYSGQGFAVNSILKDQLATGAGTIPVIRLLAKKSNRIEPITYWLTTGKKVGYPGWETKKIKLQYALSGKIPDGLLMRVSSVTASTDRTDIKQAYDLQNRFSNDMLTSVSPSQRMRLTGNINKI
jgi:EpsI family protein